MRRCVGGGGEPHDGVFRCPSFPSSGGRSQAHRSRHEEEGGQGQGRYVVGEFAVRTVGGGRNVDPAAVKAAVD
jgi:hypothetical protein